MIRQRQRKGLTTTQQAIGLRLLDVGRVSFVRDELRYECELQPTELSRRYSCVLIYRAGMPPIIRM